MMKWREYKIFYFIVKKFINLYLFRKKYILEFYFFENKLVYQIKIKNFNRFNKF